MDRRAELHCVQGVGVEGDRYSLDQAKGRYSGKPEPGRQVTLIAAEGMERISRELGLDIGPQNCRRNVVTRGIHLADLLGHELRIGSEVRVFAHRPTVPCMYLEGLIGHKGIFEAIYYDAGLCCEILDGGTIAEGDVISLVPDSYDTNRCCSWPCKALFKAPVDRSPADKASILAYRAEIAARAETEPAAQKRLRLFDQAFGRKNANWDGGRPQW